jgi:hypothetical protein
MDVLLLMGCGMEADTPESAGGGKDKNTRNKIQGKSRRLRSSSGQPGQVLSDE